VKNERGKTLSEKRRSARWLSTKYERDIYSS
jgi:hypothetical protein